MLLLLALKNEADQIDHILKLGASCCCSDIQFSILVIFRP